MNRLEEHRAYYDNRWSTADDHLGPTGPTRLRLLRQAMEGIRKAYKRPLRILDFGCGRGHYAQSCEEFGTVVGVDLSPAAIAYASRQYPDIDFRAADVLTAEIEGTFDVVLSIEVLEHIHEQTLYVRRMHRLLREGGHLLLTMPNHRAGRWYWARESHRRAAQPVEKWLRSGELKRLLSAEFQMQSIRTFWPQYSHRGIMRVVNSAKLDRVLTACRQGGLLGKLWEKCGLGLHFFVHATAR